MPKKSIANHISTKTTSQRDPIPNRESEMIENNAGGYGFKINDFSVLRRFLIIGTEGNTYYVSEKDATKDNAKTIINMIKSGKGKEIIDETVRVSDEGLAKNNNYAILVLALVVAYGSEEEKQYAISNMTKIVRIGTHVLTLASYLKEVKGWGKATKQIFKTWYESKDDSHLLYQVLKYQNRNGWEHRDILRLSHIKAPTERRNLIYKYIVKKDNRKEILPEILKINKDIDTSILEGFEKAKQATTEKEIISIIKQYNLEREFIPTQFQNKKEVQRVILPNLKLTALIRNLGSYTSSGLLEQTSFDEVNYVINVLTNKEYLQKSRIHPIQILEASTVYQSGKGLKGNLSWKPVQKIIDALNDAFYMSFKNVEPTGKRIMLALDVSGSMSSKANGCNLSCCQITAAMALVTANVETNYAIFAFNTGLQDLSISPKMSLSEVLKKVSNINYGGTDCSLPMIKAIENNWKFDAFCIYTDNETWAGRSYPSQEIKKYRNKSGITNSKVIVSATTAIESSIADPKDKNMIDIEGFSSETPKLISDFISEKF